MATKSLSFILISTLMVVSSSLFGVSASFGGRKALAPFADPIAPSSDSDLGFVPLNTKDPEVIELGKYSIDEYNKSHDTKLVYAAVFEAFYTDNEEGRNYGLVVAATDDKKELNDYEVNVLVTKEDKKLTSFRQDI